MTPTGPFKLSTHPGTGSLNEGVTASDKKKFKKLYFPKQHVTRLPLMQTVTKWRGEVDKREAIASKFLMGGGRVVGNDQWLKM